MTKMTLRYKTHAQAKLLETLVFSLANRYEPALEGLMRAYVSRNMLIEREKCKDQGINGLAKAAMERLSASKNKKECWPYTKKHSMEVGFLAYLIVREARRHKLPEAKDINPDLVFIGGLLHDIGKTFLPAAIVIKELGVDLLSFRLFRGVNLTEVERRLLRYEHITAGTTFERLFGRGPHIRVVFDITGLHHVSYNGLDNGAPSYPSLICGKDLPFHSRVAKTADFVSAVRPRHYRQDNAIQTIDDAIAYAVSVAGIELDPLTVTYLLTGFYDISQEDASEAIRRYANPGGQKAVSDIPQARQYAKEFVASNPFFRQMAKNRAVERIRFYVDEMMSCARKYGIENYIEIKTGIL